MQTRAIIFLVIVLNGQAAVLNKNIKYDAKLRDLTIKGITNEDSLIKRNRENQPTNNVQVNKEDTEVIYYETLSTKTLSSKEKNIAEKDAKNTQRDHTLDADDSKSELYRDGSLNLHRSAEVRRKAGNVIDLDSTEDENRVKRDEEWVWSVCPDGEHYETVDGRLGCVKDQEGSSEFSLDYRANFGRLSCPSNTRPRRMGGRVFCVK